MCTLQIQESKIIKWGLRCIRGPLRHCLWNVPKVFTPSTLIFAAVPAVLGLAGKYASGHVAGSGLRPSVIGWGMVPRGEVA